MGAGANLYTGFLRVPGVRTRQAGVKTSGDMTANPVRKMAGVADGLHRIGRGFQD
jgi:hypothetical protein